MGPPGCERENFGRRRVPAAARGHPRREKNLPNARGSCVATGGAESQSSSRNASAGLGGPFVFSGWGLGCCMGPGPRTPPRPWRRPPTPPPRQRAAGETPEGAEAPTSPKLHENLKKNFGKRRRKARKACGMSESNFLRARWLFPAGWGPVPLLAGDGGPLSKPLAPSERPGGRRHRPPTLASRAPPLPFRR